MDGSSGKRICSNCGRGTTVRRASLRTPICVLVCGDRTHDRRSGSREPFARMSPVVPGRVFLCELPAHSGVPGLRAVWGKAARPGNSFVPEVVHTISKLRGIRLCVEHHCGPPSMTQSVAAKYRADGLRIRRPFDSALRSTSIARRSNGLSSSLWGLRGRGMCMDCETTVWGFSITHGGCSRH
jgi:hypothetical protein